MRTLTADEVRQMSARNAELWMESQPYFFPCSENSVLLCAFLESQIGRQYVWTRENLDFAYDHLNEIGVLKQRPPSEEAIRAEQRLANEAQDAQQAATQEQQEAADLAAENKRQEIADLKSQPLSVLRQLATDTRVRDLKARGLTLAEVVERRR